MPRASGRAAAANAWACWPVRMRVSQPACRAACSRAARSACSWAMAGGGDHEEPGVAQVAVSGDQVVFAGGDVGPFGFRAQVGQRAEAGAVFGVGLVLDPFPAYGADRLGGGQRLGDQGEGAP